MKIKPNKDGGSGYEFQEDETILSSDTFYSVELGEDRRDEWNIGRWTFALYCALVKTPSYVFYQKNKHDDNFDLYVTRELILFKFEAEKNDYLQWVYGYKNRFFKGARYDWFIPTINLFEEYTFTCSVPAVYQFDDLYARQKGPPVTNTRHQSFAAGDAITDWQHIIKYCSGKVYRGPGVWLFELKKDAMNFKLFRAEQEK